MTDDALDRSLRELLASRDPGPAPERLLRSVAAAPVQAHRARRFPLQAVTGLAAAIGLVAVGLAIVARPIADSPGPATARLTLVPGVGLATPAPPVLPVALLAMLFLLGVLLLRRMPTARHRAAVAAGTLLLGYGYVAAGSPAPVDDYPSMLGVFGFGTDPDVSRAVFDDNDATPDYIVDVGPGDRYRFMLMVRNDTSAPVTILGLATPAQPDERLRRHVGLGYAPDPLNVTFDHVLPFEEQTLTPGSYMTLIVLADAGPCARPSITEGNTIDDRVLLVTRAAGWERTTEVPLGQQIAVGFSPDCVGRRPFDS